MASACTVLLVQPHDDSRDLYTTSLQRAGMAVLAVADGADALDLAPQADVVVTGLRVGSVDGVDLIARLRRDSRTRFTPIIVLTASAFPRDRLRAEGAGCDLFLTLPCLPDQLTEEIRRALTLRDIPRPTPAAVRDRTSQKKDRAS
jgi:CheY-like chemotaxis protein